MDGKLDDEDGGNSSDEENDNDMTDATADTASERGATQSESADIHAMSMRKKQSLTKRFTGHGDEIEISGVEKKIQKKSMDGRGG